MLETAVTCAAGCLCLFTGRRIWKKEQITPIHARHYKRVAEKDKRAYTEKTGKAVMLAGIGIVLAAAHFSPYALSGRWLSYSRLRKNITAGCFDY